MFRRNAFFIFSFALLSFSTCGYAQIFLDDVMSQDDQKKTGVSSLTPKQKIALEDWLNEKFILKDQKPQNLTPDLTLSININSGEKIQLSDGSIWVVDPDDVAQSSTWITPFSVKLVPSGNPDYPFLLVNKATGVSVRVKKGS